MKDMVVVVADAFIWQWLSDCNDDYIHVSHGDVTRTPTCHPGDSVNVTLHEACLRQCALHSHETSFADLAIRSVRMLVGRWLKASHSAQNFLLLDVLFHSVLFDCVYLCPLHCILCARLVLCCLVLWPQDWINTTTITWIYGSGASATTTTTTITEAVCEWYGMENRFYKPWTLYDHRRTPNLNVKFPTSNFPLQPLVNNALWRSRDAVL